SSGNQRSGAVRPSLRVEELESRDLLSVSVLPHKINLKSGGPGHGIFTVRVVSDTTTAATVLQSGTPTFTVDGSTTLTPVSSKSVDFNHDGTSDLLVKFRRSALANLKPGTHTLTVGASSSASGTSTASGSTSASGTATGTGSSSTSGTTSSTPAETGTFV